MLKNIFWLSLVALLLSTGLKSQTTVIWSDNFESDKSWDLQGNFFRNTSGTVGSYSLGSVLGTARNGNYSNDLTKNSNYAQTVNIDCSSHASVNLIFWSYSSFESGYDYGYVEVSNNGGSTFTTFETFDGTEGGWTKHVLDISSVADRSSQVVLKFSMYSDYSQVRDGWNIDDVVITGTPPPVDGDFRSRSSNNWPNNATWEMFNGTNWETTRDDPGSVANVNTVSIRAGHIVTLNTNRPNGSYAIDNLVVDGTLRIGNNATIRALTVEGDVTGIGRIEMTAGGQAHTLSVGGDFTPTTFSAGSANLVLNGTANQNIGAFTYNNLSVSNGGDKTLQGDVIVAGAMNMSGVKVIQGDHNLTISDGATIAGTYSSSNMLVIDGSGQIIKEGNAASDFQMVYPVGTGNNYTPYEISSISCSGTGSIAVRPVSGIAPGPPAAEAKDLNKYWEVSETGLTISNADISLTYDMSEVGTGGVQARYEPTWYSGGIWQTPAGASNIGVNPMSASGLTDLNGVWTAKEKKEIKTYYSYRSGDWHTISTWTHDPGGTTQTATDIPDDDARIIILSGRTVDLTGDVSTANLDVAIKPGGFLNLSTHQFTNVLSVLSGQGTLKLASAHFPSATDNYFITADGGTVEYNNGTSFTLPVTQSEYNHLVLNASGIVATQLSNLTINGDFHVKQGTYRINDGSSTRRQLSIAGDVTVDSGASFTVGTGNTVANDVSGGTAPFIDYYDKQTHRVVVNGNFTNNGTVRFTNQAYPVYNAFPSNGAATVYFRGASDNTLTCNNQTDFYNIVLDKGNDQTFKLTVYSSAYNNFRLFGQNSYGGEGGGANPDLRKALWIRTGTLVLQGLTVIPSLSEGGNTGNPNSDFYIPVNAALVLDGPDVVVLATADDYQEVNAAYGVSGGTGIVNGVNKGTQASSFSIYGKLQINDGYFSTRESGGFITWDMASGEFLVNGGTVDAKQFRAAGGANGLASYTQTGGTVELRGRLQRHSSGVSSVADLVNASLNLTYSYAGLDGAKGTLNINNNDNIFSMAGGTIRILDVCGANGYAVDVFSAAKNISVTGGAIEIAPQKGADVFSIRSAAPLGSLVIDRNPASTSQVRLDSKLPDVNGHLSVVGDINLKTGDLNANGFDLSIGGDFTIANGTSYTTGTNRTIFNGAEQQKLTMDVPTNLLLHKLVVDKTSNELLLAGTTGTIDVQDSLIIRNGDLNSDEKNIMVRGHVYNAGRLLGTVDGRISLVGTSPQSIDGDGTGEFRYLKLNNNSGNFTLKANTIITEKLEFVQDRLLDIGTNNLTFKTNATIVGAGLNRYIKLAGNAGDGGVTFDYSAIPAQVFPVGVSNYTPATIGFSAAPSSYGSITVIPVNYEHPTTTTDNEALSYFWRVKSTGFTGYAGKVTHLFEYNQGDVTGSESNYRPAVYDVANYTWNYGSTADVDETNNTISDWTTPTQSADFIDGDYTAGLVSAFGTPEKFYSRASDLWNRASTWSSTGHTGSAASRIPGAGDIVIIGSGHTVSFLRNSRTPNRDPHYSASLQIEQGGVLDITYNPGSDFGMVMSHPNGNGLIRVSINDNSGSTFEFPGGDFSEFNTNLGSTELYTNNSTGGTTYWLPNGVTEYGNLMISPLGGSNIIFPNNDVVILGDLIAKGQHSGSWYCPTWNSNYPNNPRTRIAKTITIKGDFDLQGGALIYYGNNNLAQDFIIHGDLKVAEQAGIGVYGSATNQSISIGGSLINNASAPGGGNNGYRGCDFTDIPLIFFGDNNASITNVTGTPYTRIETITVKKGNSQATSLTMDIAGTVNYESNEWLTLVNGTFKYQRSGTVYLNTNNSFTIPQTAGLYIDTPDDFVMCYGNSDDYDMYLNGKLALISGRLYIGDSSRDRNNDIEYSGGGASEIEVQGGQLNVNGQIRRNPASTAGILKYSQSGGSVTINGRNALTTNAKLEILNAGSAFNMSGGTLNILRGGGGTTYGDLYLRPESANVTGGEINFSNPGVGTQNYLLDANVALNDLTINGNVSAATVKLLISPLSLEGDLTINNGNSILDANVDFNVNVTIGGNFNNSGVYNYYKNITTFDGTVQTLTGSSAVSFYDLVVQPFNSLTLSKNIIVNNDLTLSQGTLEADTYAINVYGDVVNNANYNEDGIGIILNGTNAQELSGTGTFGRLELNNINGVTMLSNVTLKDELVLTQGVFNINKYLLSLGQSSSVSGSFGTSTMITTNGVFSNQGVEKVISMGASTFTLPLGVAGKYTPAVVDVTASDNVASIRFNPVNDKHPAQIDAANVLNYYWAVESTGLNGFDGSLELTYVEGDVQGDEANYFAARLFENAPETIWSKTNNVNEATNTITFYFSRTNNLTGEYTAGIETAFPTKVPQYTSLNNGHWSDETNWVQTGGDTYACPAGGPNGFIVIIDHEVTLDANFAQAYRTTINTLGKLKVDANYYGHNLGEVSGSGTLYLEDGQLPEGRYSKFLGCANNSTLEYGGTSDYAILADLYNNAANLIFTGSGRRVLPNEDLTICHQFLINGPVVDNSVYNKALYVEGGFELQSGNFVSGSGSSATVSFVGSTEQVIGNFTGVNALNNLEVNNTNGLVLDNAVELTGLLKLTNGVISTSSVNSLTISNTATNCVTPDGGKSTSYVNGPLTKKMNQGDTFRFPVGADGESGNKLVVSATRTGTKFWTAEYHRPNPTSADFSFPLTAVNSHEYWTLRTPGGGEAIVKLGWDAASDISPVMTEHGLADIRVTQYDGAEWQELPSTATGNDNIGTVVINFRVTVSDGGIDFTTATVNTNKPKVRLNPTAAVCDLTSGIPLEIVTTVPTPLNYVISYSIDNVDQPSLTLTGSPYALPTTKTGVYVLTGFTYDNGTKVGVVDVTQVEVFAAPTVADAGADQSLQGLSQATLQGNSATLGVGLWTIVSGSGGSFVNPANPTTLFNGTNGSTYVLRWTIANGDCSSVDEVNIAFPLLPPHTWQGDVSNDWFTAGNWTDGIVPNQTTDVTIVAGTPHDAVISGTEIAHVNNVTITSGTLTVKPGGHFTVWGAFIAPANSLKLENTNAEPASFINHGSITGDVTIQWTYDARRYWYIGHGTMEFQLSSWGKMIDPPNVYVYDFNRNWSSGLADQIVTQPLKGYSAIFRNTTPVSYTGELNTTDLQMTLIDGWQLVANPYASYYQLRKQEMSNTDFEHTTGSVYVRTGADQNSRSLATYNTLSGIATPADYKGIIAPMQAFWVKRETQGIL